MLELNIDSIRVSPMNYQRVVILKEKESDRYLPIWIGPAEADAIAVKLQDLSVPRPLTHDLLLTVLGALGTRLEFFFHRWNYQPELQSTGFDCNINFDGK